MQRKTGVPPLHCNELTLHNTNDKAETLNSKFHSVFTCNDLSNFPQQISSSCPFIPKTCFSVDSILQLLNSLDINKASDPDNIYARFVKI